MFDKFQPIGTRVLVKLEKQSDKLPSGLYLATEYEEESRIGEVLAVGNGNYRNGELVPTELKRGDKVYLPERGGLALTEDLILFKEEELLGYWE